MSLTRRQLLVRSGAAAAWVGAGGALVANRLGAFDAAPPFDRAAFPEAGPLARRRAAGRRYDGDLEGLARSTACVSSRHDVRGRSVVLKPNLVEFFEDSSVNTDPRIVVAAANALRRLGRRRSSSAEGPGPSPRHGGRRRRKPGLLDALDDAGFEFVDLNEAPVVRTPLRTRYTDLGELWVPKILREADVVVSMPKLKTHHWVGVTLSLKNCFGCMPGRVYGWPKDVFHVRNVPRSIVDIAGAVRPSLAIVDGIVGMEGDGPLRGDAIALGCRRRLARPGRRRRHRRAPDGHGSGEDRVPDGGRPLPRPVALRADRAARRGSGAAREVVPPGARASSTSSLR